MPGEVDVRCKGNVGMNNNFLFDTFPEEIERDGNGDTLERADLGVGKCIPFRNVAFANGIENLNEDVERNAWYSFRKYKYKGHQHISTLWSNTTE